MTTKMYELKALLKEKASKIKRTRQNIREGMQKRKYMGIQQCELINLKDDYRHYHIAYSEMRGKTRDQIEKPRWDNMPNDNVIDAIKDEFYEDVCACAS